MMKPKHIGLFEGIGGFSLAARASGFDTVAWCEWSSFCQRALRYWFPEAEAFGDITKSDFSKYANTIDLVSGGFPCQGFSLAGNRLGTEDARYLWSEMLNTIKIVKPTWIIGENVTGILSMEDKSGVQREVFPQMEGRKIVRFNTVDLYEAVYTRQAKMLVNRICEDLEAEEYEVQTFAIPAASVGAPHRRERIWFVAYAKHYGPSSTQIRGNEQKSSFETWQDEIGKSQGADSLQPSVTTNAKSSGRQKEAKRESTKHFSHNRKEIFNRTDSTSRREATSNSTNPRLESLQREGANGVHGFEDASNSESERGYRFFFGEKEHSKFGSNWGNGDATHPNHERLEGSEVRGGIREGGERQDKQPSRRILSTWDNFPTQSPICGRDDGFSSRLAGIAFSRWRNESIKSFGNAVVPHIPYAFMKEIQKYL